MRLKRHPLKAEKLPEQLSQVRSSLMLVKDKSAMARVIRKWSAKSNEDLVSKDTEQILVPCGSGTLKFATEMSHCPLEFPLDFYFFFFFFFLLRQDAIIQSQT